MRRTRRNRKNENQMIEAFKYYQRSVLKGFIFVLLPFTLICVAFALFVNTPAGHEFMGWAEQDRRDERVLENLKKDTQKQLDEFTESTNEDVQNTIDDIEGTQDTQVTEQYSEEVQNTINELDGTQ